MAHINITRSKKGVLQAKIQAYGKDPVTCKPKLFTRRVYNEDGLTEAKFKKYVEKVAIEFASSSVALANDSTSGKRSTKRI